jgi:hypothetical protein
MPTRAGQGHTFSATPAAARRVCAEGQEDEMTDEIAKKKRGRKSLPKEDKRTHLVSVRVNGTELSIIDARRGGMQRGTWVRHAAFQSEAVKSVPELNRQAYIELARAAANLNQLSHRANADQVVDIADLSEKLSSFRMALLGAKS